MLSAQMFWGASIRSKNGAASRKGCVADGQTTLRANNTWVRPPPTPSLTIRKWLIDHVCKVITLTHGVDRWAIVSKNRRPYGRHCLVIIGFQQVIEFERYIHSETAEITPIPIEREGEREREREKRCPHTRRLPQYCSLFAGVETEAFKGCRGCTFGTPKSFWPNEFL